MELKKQNISLQEFSTQLKVQMLTFNQHKMISNKSSKGNKKYSVGLTIYPNGIIFEGYTDHKTYTRFGRCIFSDTEYYIGKMKRFQRHGYGTNYNNGQTNKGMNYEDNLDISESMNSESKGIFINN